MTPLLVLLFGFHPITAVGTDLLYASATKSVGTVVHGAGRTVDWRIVRRLSLGSIPAAVATLLFLSYAGQRFAGTQHVISVLLGVTLILTAFATVSRRLILARFARVMARVSPDRIGRATIVLGGVLGILVTLSSIGAGAIGMTVLIGLYPASPVNRLVGTDIAHAVPLTLIAGLGHLVMGSVDLSVLASLLAGSVPGVVLGSLLSGRVSEAALRPVLAGVLFIVGGRLLF